MKYEYLIIGGILIIQLIVFYNVLKRISRLKKFFPPVKNLSIINEEFSLNDELSLRADIIALKEEHNDDFLKTLSSTNSYLVNNKGSAADFNIIRDITERHIATIENIINSTISVPLFLGLAGTFFGIIYGLSFLDFSGGENGVSVITTDSIGSLISGVITAMIASASGLILTLINSAWLFKDALYKNEKDKNEYFDFIQCHLLPKLSRDVSESLGTLKDNLDHFNNEFGENLINYKDSFVLLNENLTKEKEFLDAVQQVGLVKLSNQIIETFEKLNNASNEFSDFQEYQTSLNKNISASIAVLKEYTSISSTFSNFNKNLDLVTSHIVESSDFYHQFKAFLENHFSEIEIRKSIFTSSIEQIDNALVNKLKELSEKTITQKEVYNELWRSTVDELNKDILTLFSKMTEYVQIESESLKNYISSEQQSLHIIFESNKEFFKDFKYVEMLFKSFSTFSEISHIHNQNLESGIKTLADLLSNEASLINVNKNLVEIKLSIEKLVLTLAQQNSIRDEQKKN